jgi:formimidoylglutamate deiminase
MRNAAGATVFAGPVLPGLVNAHSHAFQRAIAGLTERSAQARDDFWSWRDRMYGAALRITPQQLEAIAAQPLRRAAGRRLHAGLRVPLPAQRRRRPAYADPPRCRWRWCVRRSAVGIGLTLLPTLYMRSGFGAPGLREDQRRFASTPEACCAIARGAAQAVKPDARMLTAASRCIRCAPSTAGALRERWPRRARPACRCTSTSPSSRRRWRTACACTASGPIEWLLEQAPSMRAGTWCMPPMPRRERAGRAAPERCAIVLCPSTEANLGDGVFDLPAWLAAGGRWSIGSDSHVTRSWCEELRLLEYSQRFACASATSLRGTSAAVSAIRLPSCPSAFPRS